MLKYQNFNFLDEKILPLLKILIIFLIAYFLIPSAIFLIFRTTYKLNQRLMKFQKERLHTIEKTIKLMVKFILIFIFIFTILNYLKIKITAILTGTGIVGGALILIFQNSLRDLFTGWIFVFEDVFRKDENVLINNSFKGKVIDLTIRYLILETEDGSILYIPFSKIDFIQNLSRKKESNNDRGAS